MPSYFCLNPHTFPFALFSSPLMADFEPNKGVGLAILDHLITHQHDLNDTNKRPENSKLVLFGSHLKLQIPPPPTNSMSVDSPNTPMEFGIKTKNSSYVTKCSFGSPSSGPDTPVSPWISNGSLSAAEMELSEDYTCVIARGGSVTKTTRIFEDCVVDSCFDQAGKVMHVPMPMPYPSHTFLSFCHTCTNKLGHGKDIYMYRGEKAFCSDECRSQEMMMEKRLQKDGGLDVDHSGLW